MGSKTNLHGSVLGEDDVVAACHDVGVNRPARSIKGETGTDRAVVSHQADHAAYEPETRAASHNSSAHVGALGSPPFFDASMIMRVEAVERRGRQKDINGGSDVLRLGSDGMSATLRVEFHVSARSGVDTLKAGFNLLGRTRGRVNLPEHEAELPVPAQPTRGHGLGYVAFQPRAFGKDQGMVRGKEGFRDHGLDR